MSDFSLKVDDVIVPRAIEAQGGAAIDAYVASVAAERAKCITPAAVPPSLPDDAASAAPDAEES